MAGVLYTQLIFFQNSKIYSRKSSSSHFVLSNIIFFDVMVISVWQVNNYKNCNKNLWNLKCTVLVLTAPCVTCIFMVMTRSCDITKINYLEIRNKFHTTIFSNSTGSFSFANMFTLSVIHWYMVICQAFGLAFHGIKSIIDGCPHCLWPDDHEPWMPPEGYFYYAIPIVLMWSLWSPTPSQSHCLPGCLGMGSLYQSFCFFHFRGRIVFDYTFVVGYYGWR